MKSVFAMFIILGAFAAAGAAYAWMLADHTGENSPVMHSGYAKNVVFMVGDGMGNSVLTATRIYTVGENGTLAMDTMPVTAMVKTYSKDYLVTDSAAAMTAYMTGTKVDNGIISLGGDARRTRSTEGAAYTSGTPVATLLELAEAQGKCTGVVTTTRITHATPAAAYAHADNRDKENQIAEQLVPGTPGYNVALGDGIEVLLGGGRRHFLPVSLGGRRTDGRNLVEEMQAAGYTYITTADELESVPEGTTKLLGLFSMSHLPYVVDGRGSAPSLEEMTEKAIEVLENGEKCSRGYFLVVEGGRIDHGLHASNALRALEEAAEFDMTVEKVLERVSLRDTLVVVTADHGHTLTINGYPARGTSILGLVKDSSGRVMTDRDGNTYTVLSFTTGPNRPAKRSNLTEDEVLDVNYRQEAAIPLRSETHSGEDVVLKAAGAGAWYFGGTMDNTEVFEAVKEAAGL